MGCHPAASPSGERPVDCCGTACGCGTLLLIQLLLIQGCRDCSRRTTPPCVLPGPTHLGPDAASAAARASRSESLPGWRMYVQSSCLAARRRSLPHAAGYLRPGTCGRAYPWRERCRSSSRFASVQNLSSSRFAPVQKPFVGVCAGQFQPGSRQAKPEVRGRV